jgi:hypothetical protein
MEEKVAQLLAAAKALLDFEWKHDICDKSMYDSDGTDTWMSTELTDLFDRLGDTVSRFNVEWKEIIAEPGTIDTGATEKLIPIKTGGTGLVDKMLLYFPEQEEVRRIKFCYHERLFLLETSLPRPPVEDERFECGINYGWFAQEFEFTQNVLLDESDPKKISMMLSNYYIMGWEFVGKDGFCYNFRRAK